MSVHDDVVEKAVRSRGVPDRVGAIAPITNVTWEPRDTSTVDLTFWVDLGSGAVKAGASQTLMDRAAALDDPSSLVGRYVIVVFFKGSPIIWDLRGSITRTVS